MEFKINELNNILNKKHLINSLIQLVLWDRDLVAPSLGKEYQDLIIEFLIDKEKEILKSKDLDYLIEFFDSQEVLDIEYKSSIEELKKEKQLEIRIPDKLESEYRESLSKAKNLWIESKSEENFNDVYVSLDRLIKCKQKALDIVYPNSRNHYENLLNIYESGIKIDKFDEIVETLKKHISIILNEIYKSKKYNAKAENINLEIDENKQVLLCNQIYSNIGFDMNRGVVFKDIYPSCTTINKNDVRLTNFFGEDTFKVISACLHESGHGIYSQNLKNSISKPPSVSFDEGNSKIFENIIGKSKEFWSYHFKLLENYFPQLSSISLDEFYFYINRINNSVNRISSDELTYNLHIIIRYEIERDLINGEINSLELKNIWNQKYKDYLSVIPNNDLEGALQDQHWFMGEFGYFPTYIIANLISAQIFAKLKKDIPDVYKYIESANFKPIINWLTENIYSYGSVYKSTELLNIITGEDINPNYYIDYLYEKYSNLYELNL